MAYDQLRRGDGHVDHEAVRGGLTDPSRQAIIYMQRGKRDSHAKRFMDGAKIVHPPT
jgi:hypothetical protein